MDPKATAKSKRSHSQHGKKAFNTHNAEKKNPQKQQQKKPQLQGAAEKPSPSLPSNWDRYGGEGEEDGYTLPGGEERLGGVTNDEVVVPKSKGGDFRDLIEQAKSRVGGDNGLGSFFDSSVPEYIQGLSPMLSARGDSLLVLGRDDNFIVDDETMSNFEVPFLSLNLHSLAAQLAKLKLSQRLFIDAEYIPEEMETNRSDKTVMQDFEPKESSSSTKSIHDLFPVGQHGFSGNERKIGSSDDDDDPIGIGGNDAGIKVKESPSSNEIKIKIFTSLGSLEANDARDSQGHLPSFYRKNAPYSKWDMPSNVEIEKAEGDLDMLLNSFSVAEPLVSSPKTVSLENTVDDLLGETRPVYSTSTDNADASHNTAVVGAKLARHVANTGSLDDTLDDLLAETCVDMKEQKHIRNTPIATVVPSSHASSVTSHSVSKEFDDLNSWLDTLKM